MDKEYTVEIEPVAEKDLLSIREYYLEEVESPLAMDKFYKKVF